MSKHSLTGLRPVIGQVVRAVAYGGEPAIITDQGTEVAAIIPIGMLRALPQEAQARREEIRQRRLAHIAELFAGVAEQVSPQERAAVAAQAHTAYTAGRAAIDGRRAAADAA